MAAFVVSSRFSGLKIEDDDSPPNSLQLKPKPATVDKNSVKKADPKAEAKKTKSQPTKSQSAAKKKKKQGTLSTKQWEQWKQKDEELVDENYEDELQQAILLSKLDFEEKKDVYKQIQKDSEKEKLLQDTARAVKVKTKQVKKKNVMSLDQFNNGGESKFTNEDENLNEEELKSPVKDSKFFDRVKSEAKDELLKDKNNDRVKNRLTTSDEVITRVQFIDALERKDKEIAGLREELSNLKQELYTTKSRNKKLCKILGHGEMKDKAEVLIEVERLRAVQSELTAELASLHTDLEKARSMNSDPRANKDKKNGAKKKNIRFDVSSEALLAKEASSGTAG